MAMKKPAVRGMESVVPGYADGGKVKRKMPAAFGKGRGKGAAPAIGGMGRGKGAAPAMGGMMPYADGGKAKKGKC